MQETARGSVNGGKTEQDFAAGGIYDLPETLAERFVADDVAISIEDAPALPPKKSSKKDKEE
jgi:hypothetical protein